MLEWSFASLIKYIFIIFITKRQKLKKRLFPFKISFAKSLKHFYSYDKLFFTKRKHKRITQQSYKLGNIIAQLERYKYGNRAYIIKETLAFIKLLLIKLTINHTFWKKFLLIKKRSFQLSWPTHYLGSIFFI